MDRALMFTEKFCMSLAYIFIGAAFVGLAHQGVKALDRSDSVSERWNRVVMFDPTPMGATIFDKDFGKCPK